MDQFIMDRFLSRQPQATNKYIINDIQLDVVPKVEHSSSCRKYEALIDFSLTDLSLAYSASNSSCWGFESSNEQPATYPTVGLVDLQSEVCKKGVIWVALTKLGLHETFSNQVAKDLRAKVDELGSVNDDCIVHAQVQILRVSLEDDVPGMIGFELPTFEVDQACLDDEYNCAVLEAMSNGDEAQIEYLTSLLWLD